MSHRWSKALAHVLCLVAVMWCASDGATAHGSVAAAERQRADDSVAAVVRLRRLFADDRSASPARCLSVPRTVRSEMSKVAGYDAVGAGWRHFVDPAHAKAAFRRVNAGAATRCLATRLAAASDSRLRITSTVERRASDPTSFASRIRLRFEPLSCGCTPHPAAASVFVNLDLVYGSTGRSLAWFAGVTRAPEVATVAMRERLLRSVLARSQNR